MDQKVDTRSRILDIAEAAVLEKGLKAGQAAPRPGEIGYRLHAMQLSCGHPATHGRIGFYCRPPAELLTAGERALAGPPTPSSPA